MKRQLLMLATVVAASSTLVNCKKNSEGGSNTEASLASQASGKVSTQYDTMVKDYNKIKDRMQVTQFLENLEKQVVAADTPADVVFTGSLMTLVIEFESITNRMVTLLEKQNVTLHSLLLSGVMNIASFQQAYLPTDQAKAVFSYLTAPRQANPLPPIDNMRQVQEQLGLVADRLTKVYNRLNALKSKVNDQNPIVFDSKLAYGVGSFPDDIKRYYSIGTPELEATLASLQVNIHGIHLFNAYNMDDLPAIVGSLGNTAGMDGRGLSSINGMPAFIKTQIIRGKPNFWTLKTPAEMSKAGEALKLAAKHAKDAWDAAIKRDGQNTETIMTFDQFYLNPGRQSLNSIPNRKAVENLVAMMNGQVTLRSQITGEDAMVNIPRFYEAPPKDLKAFLPTEFVGNGDQNLRMVQNSNYPYRDYLWGSPTAWDTSAYNPYIVISDRTQIRAKSRIIAQSWGGWIGSPLVAPML